MNWLLPLARVVGPAFPFSAALVQAQAEATAYDVQRRLRKFEDPISALHPDVRELAQLTAGGQHLNRRELGAAVELLPIDSIDQVESVWQDREQHTWRCRMHDVAEIVEQHKRVCRFERGWRRGLPN